MAEFEVPQASVEAAVDAWVCAGVQNSCEDMELVLTAAAPHIAAAALRQAAEEMQDRMDRSRASLIYGAWLNHRADQLDGRTYEPDTPDGLLAALGCAPSADLLVKAARWDRREGREPSAEWVRMAEEQRHALLAAARTGALTGPVESEADKLVDYALFLCQNGERPPGAPVDPAAETWRGWERRAEGYLRLIAGQPQGGSGSDPGRRLGAARQVREEQW